MVIHKAAGIIIKDRKLLVERSAGKKFFISPGGSIEEGETSKEALIRELKEEFQIDVVEKNLKEFGHFTAAAVEQESNQIIVDVFIVEEYEGIPTPDNEVEQIAWITSESPKDMKIGSIFEHEVLPRLKQQNLID